MSSSQIQGLGHPRVLGKLWSFVTQGGSEYYISIQICSIGRSFQFWGTGYLQDGEKHTMIHLAKKGLEKTPSNAHDANVPSETHL